MQGRMVCFGDSTTAPRENVDIYSDQLGRAFPEMIILNRGRRGESTAMALTRFKTDVLDSHPDIVLIQFGINDASVDVWKEPPAETSRVSIEDYSANLRAFIDGVHQVKGRVVLLTPNQVRWTQTFLELYGKAPYLPHEEKGFTFILERYADAARAIAKEKHVPFVDIYALYDEWEKRTGQRCSSLLLDGIHPNTEGHQLVAVEIEITLRDLGKLW